MSDAKERTAWQEGHQRPLPGHSALNSLRPIFGLVALVALMLLPTRSIAVDGCQVLLCLAAPSWRSIPQCVPPVRQVLRDLARGKAFPVCSFGSAGNTATHDWAMAPTFCPPQYARVLDTESGPIHICDFAGAITVNVDGAAFTRTWWSVEGDAVTEFSLAAKTQLGSWDRRFDDDHAAWLATLPAPGAPGQSGR